MVQTHRSDRSMTSTARSRGFSDTSEGSYSVEFKKASPPPGEVDHDNLEALNRVPFASSSQRNLRPPPLSLPPPHEEARAVESESSLEADAMSEIDEHLKHYILRSRTKLFAPSVGLTSCRTGPHVQALPPSSSRCCQLSGRSRRKKNYPPTPSAKRLHERQRTGCCRRQQRQQRRATPPPNWESALSSPQARQSRSASTASLEAFREALRQSTPSRWQRCRRRLCPPRTKVPEPKPQTLSKDGSGISDEEVAELNAVENLRLEDEISSVGKAIGRCGIACTSYTGDVMFPYDHGPVNGDGAHVRRCRVVIGGHIEGLERLQLPLSLWVKYSIE